MKFAKQIVTESVDFPEDWRSSLIRYKSLKKVIHFVVDELESRGLAETLLLGNKLDSMELVYEFDGDAQDPRPCIKITTLDPAISHDTTIIRLEKDSDFFHLLLDGLSQAATIKDVEQQKITSTIDQLEKDLAIVAAPKKRDMYTWRHIFKLYLEASILEGTHDDSEQCDMQTYEKTRERLKWFLDEVSRLGLDKKMVSKNSKQALTKFLAMNKEIMDFKRFHLLNRMALIKILKKHDKRSGLRAKTVFPPFAKKNAVFLDGVLLSLYTVISNKILSIVPQIDNYTCPICYALAWRPIRLQCGHVYCVRCVIKANRKKIYDCPLCRCDFAVGNADATNLDRSLQNFMMLYFPKEIKEKKRDDEREQAMMDMEAITGRAWTQMSSNACCIM